MSVFKPCIACSVNDCGNCRPQDPPRDCNGLVGGHTFLGGVSCSCRHTQGERDERERRARKGDRVETKGGVISDGLIPWHWLCDALGCDQPRWWPYLNRHVGCGSCPRCLRGGRA